MVYFIGKQNGLMSFAVPGLHRKDVIHMMQNRTRAVIRAIILLLCLVIFTAAAIPAVSAESGSKKIRVGWHEPPFFIKDQYGRYSGYSYDYQCKLAAYTGWEFEYVEGSWTELLQMLKDGKIDLMSNISYMEERAEMFLYASLPMGTESYYIFVSPGNTEITSENLASLNGKKVGVTSGSIQKSLYEKWAAAHGINTQIIEMNGTDEESIKKLGKEFDAYVTLEIYGDPDIATPISKIGSSDFYFAVRKGRQDILNELDAAMNRIQDENKYYNLQLNEKYLRNSKTDLYLNPKELEWLERHGKIRVGYQDNYLAFCAADPDTGKLTGALKDCLEFFSTALENAKLDIEAVSFPTAAAALEAMKKGDVDCVFPANLSEYDSEMNGVVMTTPIMRSEMDAVVRASVQKEFIVKEDVTVAVNEGNTNYDLYLADHYPTWKIAYFVDTPAGLEAVAAGEADCVIISNYRYNNISKLCEKLRLTTVYTGVDMEYYFAVNKGETELYSILSRVIRATPESFINTALTYYSTEDVKTDFLDLIKDYLFIILTVLTAVILIILVLILRNLRAKRKVIEKQHIVDDLNKIVFVDTLTSVRNKGAFNNYIQDTQDKLDAGENVEFAIGVFDCDDLKAINDRFGHDKGDLYLKSAARLICSVFKHSQIFRIGGDEFAAVMQDADFLNREKLIAEFNEKQIEACSAAQYKWEEIRVALGVAVYDPSIDRSVNETARRADKIMYENKRLGKAPKE